MKVTLIAGHGAGDPGCIGTLNGVTYKEADEARNMVPLIAAELQTFGIETVIRDPSRNAYKDARNGLLVFPRVDYLLEVHFNAVNQVSKKDGKTTGTECLVVSTKRGRTTVDEKICAAIAAHGFRNRGVKYNDNLAVLNTAKRAGLNATLVEICFLSDQDDLSNYICNRQAIARSIAQAIADAYGVKKVTPAAQRTSRQIVQQAAKLEDSTMNYLESYRWGSDLIDKLATAISGPKFSATGAMTSRQIVQQAAKLEDSTMNYLASYRWGSDLIEKLAAAIEKR